MYKLAENGVIHPNGFFIPNDPKNRHWQDYLSWLALGNTPLPADPPPPLFEGEISKVGAKQWYIDNPNAQLLFTLSIADLQTEIYNLVDQVIIPTATAANRTRLKLLLMGLAVAVRVLVKREFGL